MEIHSENANHYAVMFSGMSEYPINICEVPVQHLYYVCPTYIPYVYKKLD